jgi:molybdopterin/thiamine biosynthesis adenylyltransferase
MTTSLATTLTEEKDIIKKNVIDSRTSRFSDALWYYPDLPVTIGGAGGIGSYLTFFLSRQKALIYLYDFDNVEIYNLGGQLYKTTDINKQKTASIAALCKELSDVTPYCFGKFEESSPVTPITFSAFDNMAARKTLFTEWSNLDDRELFIDGRMLMENGQVYCVRKGNEEKYLESLFDDSEVEDQPCNSKATSHSGAIIASLMVSCLNNYMGNKLQDLDIRELPFNITYDLALMKFENID